LLTAVGIVFFVKNKKAKSWAKAAPIATEMLYYKRGRTRGVKMTEISIATDGRVIIKVGKEVQREFTLNKAQREEIKVMSNAAFGKKLEPTYLITARDLPPVTLRYAGKSVVFHNRNAPDDLVNLARKVKAMTSSE